MGPAGTDAPTGASPPADAPAGVQLGKRYGDDEIGLELLVTRAGAGPLQLGGAPLQIRQPKPLPSSD